MDAGLILDTLERASERCADPAPLIYRRLFELRPEFRSLFVMDTDGGVRGSMRSGTMPNRSHHTLSRLNPPTPVEANGEPLSERILAGKPYSRKVASISGRTKRPPVRSIPWHRNR